jgi:hypothetical protein
VVADGVLLRVERAWKGSGQQMSNSRAVIGHFTASLKYSATRAWTAACFCHASSNNGSCVEVTATARLCA